MKYVCGFFSNSELNEWVMNYWGNYGCDKKLVVDMIKRDRDREGKGRKEGIDYSIYLMINNKCIIYFRISFIS